MRWVRDLTGRFPKRPHYDTSELDQACQDLVHDLDRVRHRPPGAPLSSDDLAVLIEQRAADLDLYADLTPEGADVEAVTDFAPGQRPRVRISHHLSDDPRRARRLRSTLAHELAHVVFHDFIWWFDQGSLDAAQAAALSPRCHRRARLAGPADWMEWQAGYASGALLMPLDALRQVLASAGGDQTPWARAAAGRARLRRVQQAFDVSAQAASVRLVQLGLLSTRPTAVVRAPVPRLSRR